MSKRQEAFDKIVAAMAAQNWERSMSSMVRYAEGSGCRYRGDRDMKCAIGVLLDDAEAKFCDELACGVNNMPLAIEDRIVRETGFAPGELAMIQRAHDRGNIRSSMRTLFAAVAKTLGLEMKL